MKIKLIIILFLIQFSGYSQNSDTLNSSDILKEQKTILDKEKPFRLGLKIGTPSFTGLNFEYLTPVYNSKLALTVDLSYFPSKPSKSSDNLHGFRIEYGNSFYFELGSNYYLLKKGKSLYVHLSYGLSRIEAKYKPWLSEIITKDNIINTHLINIKTGAKWGNSFYFRPEIGYAIILGPSKIEIETILPAKHFITESGKDEVYTFKEDLPILIGGITFNISFGLAF